MLPSGESKCKMSSKRCYKTVAWIPLVASQYSLPTLDYPFLCEVLHKYLVCIINSLYPNFHWPRTLFFFCFWLVARELESVMKQTLMHVKNTLLECVLQARNSFYWSNFQPQTWETKSVAFSCEGLCNRHRPIMEIPSIESHCILLGY